MLLVSEHFVVLFCSAVKMMLCYVMLCFVMCLYHVVFVDCVDDCACSPDSNILIYHSLIYYLNFVSPSQTPKAVATT